ncbi:hypothetical protein MXB_3501 [Myxobolus squamalis]|nr:hypothetical protein MXB_3501 [Myxobolus squamalis]
MNNILRLVLIKYFFPASLQPRRRTWTVYILGLSVKLYPSNTISRFPPAQPADNHFKISPEVASQNYLLFHSALPYNSITPQLHCQ